jgi:trk system potassium uptake protein TrkH
VIHSRHLKERYRVILGYAGTIFIGIAFLMLLPLLAALLFGEEQTVAPLLGAIFCAVATGSLLRVIFKVDSEISLTIQEGGIIVLLAWTGAILFSALPFIFAGQLNFTQAIFEATSGWTTTGLSVVDVTQTPKSFLLWRSVMQFIGGAGFSVIMLSAIIGPLGSGLFNAEGHSDKLLPNVAQSAKMIMVIYLSYAAAGVVLYALAGMSWFDAVIHTMSSLSTGGFSTQVNSIGDYNRFAIEAVTMILMMLGATSFSAHYLLFSRRLKEFLRVQEMQLLWALLLFFVPIVVFFSIGSFYPSITISLRTAIFQVVSALTTTGYQTVDLRTWSDFPRSFLILLMIIGGMAGSTAGGIKPYRILIMLKSFIWNIHGYFLPRNVIRENIIVRPDGPVFLKKHIIIEAINYVTIYVIFFMIGTSIFMAYGHTLSDSMFEMASSLSTVGLSIGISASSAPPVILWTQTISMLLGRLEFFVVFFASIKIFRDMQYVATHRG